VTVENRMRRPMVILMTGANPDDPRMLHRAFPHNRGPAPSPSLILRDLGMPRKQGPGAPAGIKNDSHPRQGRVVVLASSNAEDDVGGAFEARAASFIKRPAMFQGLAEAAKILGRRGLGIVDLPS